MCMKVLPTPISTNRLALPEPAELLSSSRPTLEPLRTWSVECLQLLSFGDCFPHLGPFRTFAKLIPLLAVEVLRSRPEGEGGKQPLLVRPSSLFAPERLRSEEVRPRHGALGPMVEASMDGSIGILGWNCACFRNKLFSQPPRHEVV